MDGQYASPALAAVHETVLDLAEAGVLEMRTTSPSRRVRCALGL